MSIAAQMLATPLGRRGLAAGSPAFFDTYYCGMRQADHRRRWLDLAEQTMSQARRKRSKGRMLLLAPRDHGKTELAISIALRQVCLNRDIRILWISESAGVAEKRVRRLRALLTSDGVQEDWCTDPEAGCGPFRAPDEEGNKPKWTNTQIYVTRSKASVDPTIEAVGSGGAITGGHFDLILCDDLEDDRTTYTAGQREKTRKWWGGTVLPMLSRGGTIMVIGTRKHHDDLYHHLKVSPMWRTIEDPAILGEIPAHKVRSHWDEATQQDIVDGVDVEGEAPPVLWPEERPIEYLLEERFLMGSLLFGREFQHQVQDDAAAPVKKAWLEAAKARGANLKLGVLPDIPGFIAVQGWDLALVTDEAKAQRQDSDYVVGVGWGKDPRTGDRYLFSGYRHRGMTPGLIRAAVIGEFEKLGGLETIRAVGVERNAFGELHYMGLAKTTDLPLKPHLTTGTKKADAWDGIPALATLFENGKVVLPYHPDDPVGRAFVDVFCDEIWGLGREPHDDTTIATWIAECVQRGAQFTYRVATGEKVHTAAGTIYDEDDSAGYGDPEDMRGQRLWNDIAGMFPGGFED
jgi:phage terminase large subunit-like protein